MSLKKNVVYSYLLTGANYLIPIIVFPYVTRTLGAENIGICNWVDGIIQYFVMFSMMGISTLGVREIAYNRNDKNQLNATFTNLLILNGFTTVVGVIVLGICINCIQAFREYSILFYIGGAKLITNLFLIEWFYKGIEDFKYITIRTIIIKIVYTVLIFTLVKNKEDYVVYFFLTAGSVILTAFLNIVYSRRFVKVIRTSFDFTYVRPFLILGIYILLNAAYTTFNVGYLGMVHSKTQVGYYTTATKIFLIVLSFYSTWTTVVMPRISSLLCENDKMGVEKLINTSLNILYIVMIPISIIGYSLSQEIVNIIGGLQFIPAVPLLKIAFIILPICGIEQILVIQVMMPYKADKQILLNSCVSAVIGIVLGQYLIRNYASLGSILTWVVIEVSVLLTSILSVRKILRINYLSSEFWRVIMTSIPYILICWISALLDSHNYVRTILIVTVSMVWFLISNRYFIKNSKLIAVFNSFENKIFKKRHDS